MRDVIFQVLGRLATPALGMSRSMKRTVVLVVDASLCVLSVLLAFYLRLGFFQTSIEPQLWPILVSIFLALPIFAVSGLYRAIFRYSGLPAMIAMVRAMLLYGLIFSAIFSFWGIEGVPRTIGLIQPLVLLFLVGASRAIARIWLGGLYQKQLRKASLPQVLIYGAGSAGRQLASAMFNSHEMNVVGFLDDDDRLHGHVLNGLPIYNPAQLEEIILDINISTILLALPSVSRQKRNDILNSLSSHKIAVRTLPGLSDITTGKVSISDVRDLDIDDLLGRLPVKPNPLLLNQNTNNKIVLVTGAGGSIGGELCRQILSTHPLKLLLIEMNEFALYQIHQELKMILMTESDESNLKTEIIPLLASVCDEARMNEIISTWKPQTVYHAAAYKHVPLVEHNPSEGIINNIFGTKVCAEAAMQHNVQNFVLISTDKAVRPTNIMGATKRIAEMLLQALAELSMANNYEGSPQKTCFSIVRFGNVLDSSGSVVPLFREQIKHGGPITLTHPDVTRYFMTIPEAAQLVIQAGAMSKGGDVFVLDMGQPIRIQELALRMVELSGLSIKNETNTDGDIELQITGLRPGEKLYEELLIGDDPRPTQHERIMKAHEHFMPWKLLCEKLIDLSNAARMNDVALTRTLLKQIVSGYQPEGDVVDWVYLARKKKSLPS